MEIAPDVLEIGAIVRSRDLIVRTANEDDGRICRVVAAVPSTRWRDPSMPEFKVQLLSMPVTAFRRRDDLVVVPTV